MTTTRLLFFGPLREIAGGAKRDVEIPDGVNTGADLIEWLGSDDPDLQEALSRNEVRLCIDKRVVLRDASVAAAREIAFLPPFSGG